MEPSWHKIAPKVDPKNDQKIDRLSDGLKIEFSWILAPNLPPKRGKKSLVFGAFLALGALLAPRPPQDPPRPPPRGLLGAIWGDFGLQLGAF